MHRPIGYALWTVALLPLALAGCSEMGGADGADLKELAERVAVPADAATADGAWTDSLAEALQGAEQSGRPILANFTGSDWCAPCIQLKQRVFDTPEFRDWADQHVVLLELDFPNQLELPAEVQQQNEAMLTAYEVAGFPTILFLAPEGSVLGRIVGVRDREAWLRQARDIVDGYTPAAPTAG